MTAHILALTHGFLGFGLGFLLIAVSTYAGLIRHRAPWRDYFLWPLPGIGIMLLCVLIFWFLFAWLPGEGTAVVGILRILVGLVLFLSFGYTMGETLATMEEGSPVSRSPVSRSTRATKPSTSSSSARRARVRAPPSGKY